MNNQDQGNGSEVFLNKVKANQANLKSNLRSSYDFIVCGSGSSGSVVARRLAEIENASVLLLEAGGLDEIATVSEPNQWPLNIGSERDWAFAAHPSRHLNGRSMGLPMGKLLGGGSSINAMIWSRGHKSDWDFFAEESGDPSWSYESILRTYQRIEDWHGSPDPSYRGTGGTVFVQPAPDPHPMALAMLVGAKSVGIPVFDSPNGIMVEGAGGSSIVDTRIRNGKRLSIFRTYIFPYMDRPNLTVLPNTLVSKVLFEGKRATGVEVVHEGKTIRIGAGHEVILSLGAFNTPKVLMQSGVGDQAELQRFGIPLVQHLPGVGQNFQDHIAASCIWESEQDIVMRNNGCEATVFWKSDPSLPEPDVQPLLLEFPYPSPDVAGSYPPPQRGWSLFATLIRPKSTGYIRLTGPAPSDPLEIHSNTLAHPDDVRALIRSVELCREIGNSAALRPFAKREVVPGKLPASQMDQFVRNAAVSYCHETCTSKMGRDAMSVVDSHLKVYGVENLRIADGSIMPRITTGNTMAPCVVIGERAAEIIKTRHRASSEAISAGIPR
ncbi:GMC family oxidoreductase [Terriglobus saanensis]|uniref:Glucose-methanol-choline oxidoreductase n=1 Tax=Terriglobus saanensis (strain ATCC BAA-1853 / DSM 23119 / SP1PR4) TaxID=401053 RepID=E8V3I5_TERSS|nr:GMC family oxidoreductase N-terminal domain-containing protein [Terriglobus saanensis]ADV83598.1 glucose-methanol-choline oxidoreductase [Terriglobus saanensis SP1PR4]